MRTLKLFIVFLTIYSTLTHSVQQYCRTTCKESELNIVCKRKKDKCGLSPEPSKHMRLMTDDDRLLILRTHNSLREQVASGSEKKGLSKTESGSNKSGMPSASNMHAISYDLELEFSAMCHVASCSYFKDKCKKTPKYFFFGENAAFFTGPRKQLDVIIMSWYDEINNHSSGNSIGSKASRKFSQIINAKTNRIGCGYNFYGASQNYFICYDFPHRYTKEYLYDAGTPQSRCANNIKNRKYKSLCGLVRKPPVFFNPFDHSGEDSFRITKDFINKNTLPEDKQKDSSDEAFSDTKITVGYMKIIFDSFILWTIIHFIFQT